MKKITLICLACFALSGCSDNESSFELEKISSELKKFISQIVQ
ncbi:hypothetical protein GASC598I20_010620 [Gilliamella apicola SCGC AB-598-I20]|nr:hypothetical protein GASC598I20_010620 [Gilliamella apicola SCGC AB-598-I20]